MLKVLQGIARIVDMHPNENKIHKFLTARYKILMFENTLIPLDHYDSSVAPF